MKTTSYVTIDDLKEICPCCVEVIDSSDSWPWSFGDASFTLVTLNEFLEWLASEDESSSCVEDLKTALSSDVQYVALEWVESLDSLYEALSDNLLKSEHGIDEQSWASLLRLGESLGLDITKVAKAKATDGCFYYPLD